MTLFQFEWFRCRDGYRIEQRPVPPHTEEWLEDGSERSSGSERFIVPNSPSNWEPYRPLELPAPYRKFANWAKRDTSERGLLKLITAYGSLWRPKAKEERTQDVVRFISSIQDLVEAIDRHDWQSIAQGLERSAQRRNRTLAVVFEVSADQPILKFQPDSLYNALQVQALSDASRGIEHRECKNPECDRWFPTAGPGAYRSDAEYHSPACQRRHTYIKRLKKERRS